MDSFSDEPSRKRRRIGLENDEDKTNSKRNVSLISLDRPISPPPLRRHPAQKIIDSPFQLTTIEDLPASSNVGAVSLKDILGDPLISEVWEFNYLHNLDFLMEALDEDVRDMVKVHVIHGFWKEEDQSRRNLIVSRS